jgi:hypothetical protein
MQEKHRAHHEKSTFHLAELLITASFNRLWSYSQPMADNQECLSKGRLSERNSQASTATTLPLWSLVIH